MIIFNLSNDNNRCSFHCFVFYKDFFYFIFFKDNFNYYIIIIFLKNYSFNSFNFIPLIILAVLSIFIGYFTKVIFMGIGNNIFW